MRCAFLLLTIWVLAASVFSQNTPALPKVKAAHQTPITTLAFSPDGFWFASGDLRGEIIIRRYPDWQVVQTLALEEAISGLVFASDSQWLLVTQKKQVRKVSLIGDGIIEPLDLPKLEIGPVRGPIFSADGTRFAYSFDDVFIFNYPSMELQKTFPIQSKAEEGMVEDLADLAFSPDGTLWAPLNYTDPFLDVLDASGGKTVAHLALTNEAEFPGAIFTNFKRKVLFSPNSRGIAASHENKIFLKNLDSNRTQTLEGHTNAVRALAFSPDGGTLISASDDHQIFLWDVASGKRRTVWNDKAEVWALAISPDGQTVATGGMNQAVSFRSFRSSDSAEPFLIFGQPIPTYNHGQRALRKNAVYTNLRNFPFLLDLVSFCSFWLYIVLFFQIGCRKILEPSKRKEFIVGSATTTICLIALIFHSFTLAYDFFPFLTSRMYFRFLVVPAIILVAFGSNYLCTRLGWFIFVPNSFSSHSTRKMLVQDTVSIIFYTALVCAGIFLLESVVWGQVQLYRSGLQIFIRGDASWLENALVYEVFFRAGLFVLISFWLRDNPSGTWLAALLSTLIWAMTQFKEFDPMLPAGIFYLSFGMAQCFLFRKGGIVPCIVIQGIYLLTNQGFLD